LTLQKNWHVVVIVLSVWALVAAWHPFFLGFFSDDWSLFILRPNEQFLLKFMEMHPTFPKVLLRSEIDPGIIAARPGYAFALYCLKIGLSDSPFLWQSISALLLLAAASTVYVLASELLCQYQYEQNKCQFGAAVAASVYLIGPWSIVMSTWPTAAITLLSQIFVAIGLTKLASNRTKHPFGAAFCLLIGFLIYEAYWFLFVSVVIILWATNRWTIRECLRFSGIMFAVLIIAILIKAGLSRELGIPGKAITIDFLPMFLQNIKAYPRVVGDALQPIGFKYLLGAVLAIVFFSFALEGIGYRREGALFGSLFVGLVSSALLYAVVGYNFLRKIGVPSVFIRLYDPHHVNHFSKESLQRLFTKDGMFRLEKVIDHNTPLAAIDIPSTNSVMKWVMKFGVAAVFFVGQITKKSYLQTIVISKLG